MKRASKKQREIRFHSGKCGRIICVNSYAEQEYAKRLEADDRVENYEENCRLDPERFQATTLEQLELSRRYWEAVGVSDWRVALFREGGVSPAP